jgi:hypothetical protein
MQDRMDMKWARFEVVRGYQKLVQEHLKRDWEPSLISFMFHQLPGSNASVLRQMKQEIYRVNARLVTRFDRNPRSKAGFNRLPRMVLFPDVPVYKHEKKSIEDVSINDGLHYGGIALAPPVSRFQSTLQVHFARDQEYYVSEKLARIHVTPITSDVDYVVEYAAKSFTRGRVLEEDIIILPKVISELPHR